MTKQITIEMSEEKWNTHFNAVGEITGIATFLEANVSVEEVGVS